jgi:hypothetical protein
MRAHQVIVATKFVKHRHNSVTCKDRPVPGSEAVLIRPFPRLSLPFWTLLAALVAVDLGFILINVLAFAAQKAALIAEVPEMLKITRDGALPEDFNYLKWALIVVALLWVAFRDRWLPALLWAAVFTMILLDDSLQLHEAFGSRISSGSRLPSNRLFNSEDLGEVLVFAVMGLVVAVLTATLFTRRGEAARRISLRYLLVILGLGFFGVGVDAIHQMVAHLTEGSASALVMSQAIGLIEESGEMIVASLAAAFTLASDGAASFDAATDPA